MNTEFERWMVKNHGYKLTHGKGSAFSTYNNCGHSYSNGDSFFTIGLLARPTRIGLICPLIPVEFEVNGRKHVHYKEYDRVPIPDDFEMLRQVINKNKNV